MYGGSGSYFQKFLCMSILFRTLCEPKMSRKNQGSTFKEKTFETRRRLKAFTRDVLVYVRTILNGVGQLSSTWVGTICERETEMFSIRVLECKRI